MEPKQDCRMMESGTNTKYREAKIESALLYISRIFDVANVQHLLNQKHDFCQFLVLTINTYFLSQLFEKSQLLLSSLTLT